MPDPNPTAPRAHARLRAPMLLALSGPLVAALVVADAPGWLRAAPVLAYVAVVPGLAYTRLLRLADRLLEVLLGIGLSLALGVLVAQSMLWTHRWSATLGLCALALLGTAAAVAELWRNARRPAWGGGAS